jgi:hypothetical protein
MMHLRNIGSSTAYNLAEFDGLIMFSCAESTTVLEVLRDKKQGRAIGTYASSESARFIIGLASLKARCMLAMSGWKAEDPGPNQEYGG